MANLARHPSRSRRAERLAERLTERLEARVTADQKQLLQEAAGRDLVVLSAKDREVFVRALLNPPALKGGRLARATSQHRRAAK